jgi:predicted membrane-bound dolichyl-phosphate-mannose-protein mannosyltransferase
MLIDYWLLMTENDNRDELNNIRKEYLWEWIRLKTSSSCFTLGENLIWCSDGLKKWMSNFFGKWNLDFRGSQSKSSVNYITIIHHKTFQMIIFGNQQSPASFTLMKKSIKKIHKIFRKKNKWNSNNKILVCRYDELILYR